MEKAIWQGKTICASDIKDKWEYEKNIRLASANRELMCPDIGCHSPILKYCHGNLKRPYFAHKKSSECDYDKYDRQNTPDIDNIKLLIYRHLISKGFKADIDSKVSDHHYAHVVIYQDNKKFAIELVQDSITVQKINKLVSLYKKANTNCVFIVIGSDVALQKESDSNFVRRFSLNESDNNGLLIINIQGTSIHQYRLDNFKYTYCGEELYGYQSIYSENSYFKELTFENGTLTINGFNKRYTNWFNKKQEKYNAFIAPQHYETSDNKTETKSDKAIKEEINDTLQPKEILEKPNYLNSTTIKAISELAFIESISLPAGKAPVPLYTWEESDFLKKICEVCYQNNEIAFKMLITKFKKITGEEMEIVKKLGQNFKQNRPDYYYILKTAYKKAQK